MSGRAALGHADNRPRIHIWPHLQGAAWSKGPLGPRTARSDPGAALNSAIAETDIRRGVVVIIEPAP